MMISRIGLVTVLIAVLAFGDYIIASGINQSIETNKRIEAIVVEKGFSRENCNAFAGKIYCVKYKSTSRYSEQYRTNYIETKVSTMTFNFDGKVINESENLVYDNQMNELLKH